MKTVQALHADIEWRRMRDDETYYPLRDGPRIQRGQTAIHTMAKLLPPDHVALADNIAAWHAMAHSGHGRGAGEIAERVQGGDGHASLDERMRRLSAIIRHLAGLQAAAMCVGSDAAGCFRGICYGDTQAEMMRRIRYPHGSLGTFRRLVQETMIALQDRNDRHPLDLESNLRAYSR